MVINYILFLVCLWLQMKSECSHEDMAAKCFTKKDAQLVETIRIMMQHDLFVADQLQKLESERLRAYYKIIAVIEQCKNLDIDRIPLDDEQQIWDDNCETCKEQAGVYTKAVCKACEEIIQLADQWQKIYKNNQS